MSAGTSFSDLEEKAPSPADLGLKRRGVSKIRDYPEGPEGSVEVRAVHGRGAGRGVCVYYCSTRSRCVCLLLQSTVGVLKV
jgi:hypothetical protein